MADFEIFPLSRSNVSLVEGVWRGESIDISIEDSGFLHEGRPVLWVKLSDYEADEQRRGVIYYSKAVSGYSLYLFATGERITIDMGIFEFTGSAAEQFGTKCKAGGSVLKLEFILKGISGEVLLTKETLFLVDSI